MRKDSKIYVAGHRGLVGSAIKRKLIELGYNNIITKTSKELDLRNQSKVESFFKKESPEYVFLAAAKVGGILANNTYKAEFIYDNVMLAANVIHSSFKYGVKKLLNLGSSCIYPKLAPQPMKEEHLLTGTLEKTNEPYAIAKITAIKLVRYYNEQYGTNFISIMPTNLYGPNDNYNLETAHVLPALIRKFHLAKLLEEENFEQIKKDLKGHPVGFGLEKEIDFNNKDNVLDVLSKVGIKYRKKSNVTVTIWGTGEVFREFMFVDDLADAAVFLMQNVSADDMKNLCEDYFVNIGTGEDIKIKDLVSYIREIIGFKGDIEYDRTKPDGTPRKLLDVSKINALGWKAKTSLSDGIKKTYKSYLR